MLDFAISEDRLSFRTHQYLAREGQMPDAIYRIEEGWACRFRLMSDGRRQITGLFLPGDLCEPQWTAGQRITQPVVALTSLRALRFDIAAARSGRSVEPGHLWRALSAALEWQVDWVVSLGRKNALERIAHLLCDIYERLSRQGLTYGQQCSMPLTQMDLADLTGLTPVHVNRTLQAMRSDGLIELEARWLRIPDLPSLRAAACLPTG